MSTKKDSLFFVVLSVVLILFLILDFTYSKFLTHQISTQQKKINISHKVFHHHLLPNSVEIQGGGEHPKFKVVTNSLGFRDSKVREIDLKKK